MKLQILLIWVDLKSNHVKPHMKSFHSPIICYLACQQQSIINYKREELLTKVSLWIIYIHTR